MRKVAAFLLLPALLLSVLLAAYWLFPGSRLPPTAPDPPAIPQPAVTRTARPASPTPATSPTRRSGLLSTVPAPSPTNAQQPTFTTEPVLVSPVPATPAPDPVAVWEGTVSLNTYGWQQALVATSPDDPIYPYPRLDFDAVAGPAPVTYRAVFLQNEAVQLVVLPDLGGRILRWTDRVTGRQLFYANPVVRPTRWGYRGWWLATGGMEWAFPTEEHGLTEYRPWEYELLWNGVRVWDTDDRSGLTVEVSVQLEAGSNRVAVTPRIHNPTPEAHTFQFWANAMLTLSDSNVPSPDLVFILPASEVVLHSTGDSSLPAPGGRLSWPLYQGRDFSRYPEWRSYLGVFAPEAAGVGFAGAYDLGTDQGIVRVAPAWVQGVKLFCLGDLDSRLWTDDGSRYFELWAGLTPTFWHSAEIEPGGSVAWTEYWYAVSGISGYSVANGEGAARVTVTGGGTEVAVVTVRPVQATVVLLQGAEEVGRWEALVGPDRPFRALAGAVGGELALRVVGPDGIVLIQVGP